MSEPAAPYAPACTPADSPQTHHAPRRCFDHACPVAEGCPLYQRRAGPPYGPVACSWRYGWEYRDGLCAVARGEAGDNPITEPPSEVAPC